MRIRDPGLFQSCMFIINPQKNPAGAGRLKRYLREVSAARVVESKNRAHFEKLVRLFCSSGYEYLLIYGGDGSIHTAINEVMRYGQCRRKKSIGFFRGGSGNGYQDSYGIPFTLSGQLGALAASLRERFIMEVDLLKIESGDTTIYGQLAGIGFDAHVLKVRRSSENVHSGLFNYLLPAVLQFITDFNRVNREYLLELVDPQGGWQGKGQEHSGFRKNKKKVWCRMIEIGKRTFYGNRFRICPDALCDNGCIEVYLFNFNRRIQVARYIISLWRGRYERVNRNGGLPFIEHYRVKCMKLTACSPIEMHVDGERFQPVETEDGSCLIKFSVLPQAISIVVPGGFYRKYRF